MLCCIPRKRKKVIDTQNIIEQEPNEYPRENIYIDDINLDNNEIEEEEIEEEEIEEEEIENIIEEIETHICLKCNAILRLNELYSITIEKTHLNVCKKCHSLSEKELQIWYNSKCVKNIKDKILTVKYKLKNYIFVKYENEDIEASINRFIKLIGINNEKIIKKVNILIKNKL